MSVFLNDLGIVCALGSDKQSVFDNFIRGDESGMIESAEFGFDTFVGEVRASLPDLSEYAEKHQTRNNQLALLAFRQIETQLQQVMEGIPSHRLAVVIGTSTSGIASGEASMASYLSSGEHLPDFSYSKQEMGATANFLAQLAGAKGCIYGISTACTSGAKALVSAQRLLDSGFADVVIAGGIDSLARITLNGFRSIESIASGRTRPFQAQRNGINIGEGAALFVMSRSKPGIRLAGFGESSDAHHISAPHPEGQGAVAAMQKALSRAKIKSLDISYINLHGTGTVQNDSMEARAVNSLFPEQTYCSASKALHGHCLGAAGAIEAGLCWLLMSAYNPKGQFPAQASPQGLDPELAAINMAQTLPPADTALNFCMSNSYAFGGNNTSLILAKENV